jgi:dihydrofolate reductase
MRNVVMRVFDCSVNGIIASERTAFFEYCRDLPDDPAQVAHTRGLYESADVHIMGKNLYLGSAGYFPTAVDHPYSDIMNAAHKIVFSRSLRAAEWANSTIVSGDLTGELEKLKQDGDGDIIAHGGISFWTSLIMLDLVDEYRLTVFPYLVGEGERLFTDVEMERPLELLTSIPFANGTVELQYRRCR